MIYADSYQTKIGSAFITKSIETAIKQAIIKDGLDTVSLNVNHEGKFKPIYVTGYYSSELEIPLFTHPISILNFNHQNYLCTDLRLYVRKDVSLNDIESGIRNLTEYNFVKSRSILNLLWLNDEIDSIKNSLSFAGIVYAAWLSDIIAKTFALDFKDQTIINVVAHVFYQSLFNNVVNFDNEYKEKLAVHTIKATNTKAEFVLGILDRIERLNSIEDFCNSVKDIVENVRLKDFNIAVLLTIVKNSWYGTNAKEILSVALEHPPTWIAIIYTSLNERTYKSSMLYRVAERLGKRGISDTFLNNFRHLIEGELKIAREEFFIRDFE